MVCLMLGGHNGRLSEGFPGLFLWLCREQESGSCITPAVESRIVDRVGGGRSDRQRGGGMDQPHQRLWVSSRGFGVGLRRRRVLRIDLGNFPGGLAPESDRMSSQAFGTPQGDLDQRSVSTD